MIPEVCPFQYSVFQYSAVGK